MPPPAWGPIPPQYRRGPRLTSPPPPVHDPTSISLSALDLDGRTINLLESAGLILASQVADQSADEIAAIDGLGVDAVRAIGRELRLIGLNWGVDAARFQKARQRRANVEKGAPALPPVVRRRAAQPGKPKRNRKRR